MELHATLAYTCVQDLAMGVTSSRLHIHGRLLYGGKLCACMKWVGVSLPLISEGDLHVKGFAYRA